LTGLPALKAAMCAPRYAYLPAIDVVGLEMIGKIRDSDTGDGARFFAP